MNIYLTRDYIIHKPNILNEYSWPKSERSLRLEIRSWRGQVVDFVSIKKSDLEWLLEKESETD